MNIIFSWNLWYFIVLIFFEVLYITKKRQYCIEHPGLTYETVYDYRVKFIFALLVFLPLLFIAGYRNRGFADTWSYTETFLNTYPYSISEISFTGKERAPGWIVLGVLIKQIFGNDYRIYLLIVSTISILSLVSSYRRYSSEIVFSAFLFFASTDMMSWMMNGMRQFLVASLFFAFIPLLLKKKFLFFILISALLYTIHSSALIAIPVYFLALGKPFNKKTLLVLGGVILAIVFLDQFSGLINDSLQNTNYSASASEITDRTNDDGTNILRALVYSIPAILAIVFKKKIPENIQPIISYSINMSLVTMAFYFLSVAMSGIYLGRIPIYFSLFNYILLPWEIKTFFNVNSQKIIFTICIIMYLVFFSIQTSMIVGW